MRIRYIFDFKLNHLSIFQHSCMSKTNKLCFLLFKCIVITVGTGGFRTESYYDFVIFEESNSGMFTICKLMYKLRDQY